MPETFNLDPASHGKLKNAHAIHLNHEKTASSTSN
jgi:hypothetical protein